MLPCSPTPKTLAQMLLVAGALLAVLGASPALADLYIGVDENGVTRLTDDPDAVLEGGRADDIDALRALWGGEVSGPPLETPLGSSGSEDDRVLRLLRGAVSDLRRGETARSGATLRSVLRLSPREPVAHWYLAQLATQRGRFAEASSHLAQFVDAAGPGLAQWRAKAEQRVALLADEQRLADPNRVRGPLELVAREGPNFRVQIDAELSATRADYAATVMRYLEDARSEVSDQLQVVPLEPLGVVFYGKAAYNREHAHRFTFQTVGFFDGRIHVAAPAHPQEALRSLLFHEYTHAVFNEQTGGHRPYWLNEGLAERVERRSRDQAASVRSERAALRQRIEGGDWIPLQRIAPSFSGLTDEDARAAYLESVVAAAWIEDHTNAEERARLLARLGEGYSADMALHEALGLDTAGLDEALRAEILAEFPSTAGLH